MKYGFTPYAFSDSGSMFLFVQIFMVSLMLAPLVAVICGIIALVKNRNKKTDINFWLAIIGVCLGVIPILFYLINFIQARVRPSPQQQQMQEVLKRIAESKP
jgi:uncharacterized membrane protein HdeD (DUF308 family)